MGIFVYVWVIEKYHICGLKVGVRIIHGCALYMGIYGSIFLNEMCGISSHSVRDECKFMAGLDSPSEVIWAKSFGLFLDTDE